MKQQFTDVELARAGALALPDEKRVPPAVFGSDDTFLMEFEVPSVISVGDFFIPMPLDGTITWGGTDVATSVWTSADAAISSGHTHDHTLTDEELSGLILLEAMSAVDANGAF